MADLPVPTWRSLLRTVGSLWFAAVLLVLLLVAMASATIYESTHGTERAQVVFYQSPWFAALLTLLAINVAAALVVRFPFHRRLTGFVLTHVSILVTLAGAAITQRYGISGQVGIVEGQTATQFTQDGASALMLVSRSDNRRAEIGLTHRAFSGFDTVDNPKAPVLELGGITASVMRYLPHSVLSRRVVDDHPRRSPAVEVSLSASGQDAPLWLFADRPQTVGGQSVLYRVLDDADAFARAVNPESSPTTAPANVIRVEIAGAVHELPLAECLQNRVPVGQSGYAVQVLRYFPHATVGPDRKITNASDQPVNPAVEVALSGPEGTETRLAFARFPDFRSMHGESSLDEVKITFLATEPEAPSTPVELLEGPRGELHVRLTAKDTPPVTRAISVGESVETPWAMARFGVLRRFEHARVETVVEAAEPTDSMRIPAVLVRLASGEHSSDLWLQKHEPSQVSVNGAAYELLFGDKVLDLGFALTLEKFDLGYYPGGRRPRSFESTVTIRDGVSGRSQRQVISMNHPASYGGYALFQTSYRLDPSRTISFLSVARDPGATVAFTGYVGMIAGMCVVLVTRAMERRRARTDTASQAGNGKTNKKVVVLELAAGESDARSSARRPPRSPRRAVPVRSVGS